MEASDDEYYRLHIASDESEPVDPFESKEFLLNSFSRLTSNAIRFGVYHYITKKESKQMIPESNKLERYENSEKKSGKDRIKLSKSEKDIGNQKEKSNNKIKYWWSKYIRRQKKKKEKSKESQTNTSRNQIDNYEYLLFGSSPGNLSNSISENFQDPRKLFIQEMISNEDIINSNYNGNSNTRPETYVPIEIKTSIFAAYFAAEPVVIHFSKTITRNRRVKYGQEIAVAEAFPRTINNSLSSIILARCDGTISIINQTKGLPIQSTRMFLVITCNDTT